MHRNSAISCKLEAPAVNKVTKSLQSDSLSNNLCYHIYVFIQTRNHRQRNHSVQDTAQGYLNEWKTAEEKSEHSKLHASCVVFWRNLARISFN